MHNSPLDKAPDYTNAALVMAFVNLFSALMVIWGVFGYASALIAAFALHMLLDYARHR